MGTSSSQAKSRRSRIKKAVSRRRTREGYRRALKVEGLEPRLVLSQILIDPQVWYPGGPAEGTDRFPVGGGSGNYSFNDDSRWSETATQGRRLKQGDPTVLTWSIVPDGTPIPGYAGETAAPSNLRGRLAQLYGGSATGPVKDQPWYPLFVSMFNSWADETGITYVFEPADDGVTISGSNKGIVDRRGDVRIGGHRIDGNSGILAYNFFPDVGDMVIDTADNFFDNKASNSLRLRNILAHEAGHGIGIAHVCPINQTKLLEPFYTGAFDGPQHDDILAGNRGYGDPFEEPRSNDAVNKATDLGTLADGTRNVTGASIDDALDVDFYKFTVDAPKKIAVTVSPVGSTYKSGPQNSNGSCSAGTDFNSKAQSDLSFEVYAFDGTTLLASVNATGRGADEVLSELRLPAKGEYYLKVKGLDKKAQLYDTAITVSGNTAAVRGLVHFGAPVYDIGQSVTIEVRDTDLIGSNTVSVSLTSPAGDEENVTLTHAGGGVYRGAIALASGTSVTKNNNRIEANPGQALTVTYSDADTGSGSSGTATASTVVFQEICEGPDAGGYLACTVMPTFEDIASTGNAILVNEDDTTVELTDSTLGSFAFTFYGTTYPNLFVNSNGLLTFGSSPGGAPTNSNLTSSPSPASLAVYWDDLYTEGIGDQVYWQIKGSGSSERLIVQWNDVRYATGDGDGVFFQAILYKATGVIEYNYLDLRGSTSGDDGRSATVGIKGAGAQGARRLLLANNNGPNAYVGTGKSIRISRKGLLTVDVVASSVAENAGAAATQVTISRSNAATTAALTVSLASSDTSEATVPATATIPAGQSSVTVDLAAVDDTLLDGSQNVTISATATDFLPGSDTVTVTDYETLTVVISADSFAENAGTGATTATVTRSNTDNASALTVNLASSDTTEATVPSSVSIAAGQASVSFTIDAVDDALLDGTQTITISGSAAGYVTLGDTVDVTDYETVSVVISADSIAENAGTGATTATVTRSNTDTASAITVSLASSDTTEATVPSSVTIPSGQASISFALNAIDDALLDGTQTVTITPSASGYVPVADTVDVTDYETVSVVISADSFAENAGTGATTATVTRSNTDNASALTVALTSSDTSEATVPASVTIPAGQASVSFSLDAIDDTLLDGTQIVTVTGAATGYVAITDQVAVTDYETLTIAIAADSFAENAGTGATTATVTRSNTDNAGALVVALTSNDTSEATVPASVTIPAGRDGVTFSIDAVDDALLDGTQTVTISGAASGYVAVGDTVDVTDYETLTIVIAADSFFENAGGGATTATVTRSNTDNASALSVNLASSDTSEATVPGSVTIPAGQGSVTFAIAAVDDTLLDGTQVVTVSAAQASYAAVADTVDVADYETLAVVITASSIEENAGANATTATVTRSNTDNTSALTVTLTSDDTSEATVPGSVTIPAGQGSVSFAISAVDDTLLDGTQSVSIEGSSTGYVSLADTIDVTDYETLTIAIAVDSFAENAGTGATTAAVTRSNTDNSSALTVNLASNDTSEATVPGSVTIPAGQGSVTFAIAAVDDTLLDGTQVVTVSPSSSGYAPLVDTVDVTDYETLSVAISAASFLENAGAGATTATVTRSNSDNASALTVTLASDDVSEATVPAAVTIPAGQASVTFAVDAVDDTLLDGTQTVRVRASESRYASLADGVDVLDYETLTVTVGRSAFFENEGAAATTATITRSNTDRGSALVVAFASSDTTEATVPATATIPAGQESVTVNVDAVDDNENDGTQRVTLTATQSAYSAIAATVDVLDNEQIAVTIAPGTIAENSGSGAAVGTVARNVPDISQALTVTLSSSDTTELAVPASVTIPAGQRTATFAVDAVDDTLLDGSQSVVITATTASLGSNQATVVVADYETLSIVIAAESFAENAGTGATTATLTRSNTDNAAALTVTLSGSDSSEAAVPATVTIPAGAASVSFGIDAVDDTLLDGTQTVSISVAQAAYVGGSDSVDVTDYETLSIVIAADSFAENAGTGATTATLTRSNTDNAAALAVGVSGSDTSEASVPATVTIPAGAASVSFGIDAVDDTLLDGTQTVSISVAQAAYVGGSDSVDVTDYETLTIAIAGGSFAENAGAGATTATLTRSNTDTAAALAVSIGSSDTSEATAPATVTIPAGAASVSFAVDAVDDTLLDGTQSVSLTPTASGYEVIADRVDVTDYETLVVKIAADLIAEDAGAAATTATVTRSNTDNSSALTVSLLSSDTTEATVPSTVTIAAGEASVSFAIDAVDDAILDGTQTVTVSASGGGYVAVNDSVDVTDSEALTVVISADSIVENAGAAATTATVTRSNSDTAAALTVNLASSDVSEATVPALVTIPAGQSSVSFAIASIDDTLLDGTQVATVIASAAGYTSVSDTVDVLDYETLTVVVSADSIAENAGTAATTATVTRSNTDNSSAVTVNLASSDTSEATVPGTVTIPAGQASVSFAIDAVDDTLLDGTQSVVISASRSGYASITDGLDVTDYEFLSLVIAADSIAENAGVSATTATVTRSNTDAAAALTVILTSSDVSELTVPATVTIPAGQASVSFGLDAVDDTLLDGTQRVNLLAAAGGYVSGSDSIEVTDYETLTVSILADSIVENAGAGATTATVTRSNSDRSAALTVSLASSDVSEARVPATVTIPAGRAFATFSLDAIDDTLLDGTQRVTISAADSGYVSITDIVEVTDYETLSVVIAADSIAENSGAGATTATVTRGNSDIALAITVAISSSDTSEASVPATATIPAGQRSVSFPIDAVDDALLDGTQSVTVSVSAAGYVGAGDALDVTDYETLSVVIAADSIAENAGASATTATVARSNADNGAALVVSLASSDTSEALVPATVTIPAGQSSVSFAIDAVDDALLDGTQVVSVTGTGSGYVPVSDVVDVTDYETLSVVIAADSIAENAGASATTATVTRSNTDTAGAVTVSISSSDTSEVRVPATVTIPAGRMSVTFGIDAVDDTLLDGTQTATVTVAGSGYVGGSDSLRVTDYETVTVSIAADAIAENAGAAATTATITRSNTDNSAPLVVSLASSDVSEATLPSSVTIPAGAASVSFAIDAIDDRLLDGTQVVTVSASVANYFDVADRLDVTDYETLTVVIAADSIAENAGASATTATVTRSNTDIASALTVSLSSGDTTEAGVGTSVTIPAGQAGVTFPIDAVDDTLLDGTQTASISAASSGYVSVADTLDVTDYETLTVTFSPAAIVENAGAGASTATITRSNTDNAAALVVALLNGDTSEIGLPASATIPSGALSVTVPVDAVDDSLLDGTQSVSVRAIAERYASVAGVIDVTDYETLSLSFSPASFAEDAGGSASTGTLTRNNTDTGAALTVALTSLDRSEVTVPATVTIPAGRTSVQFPVTAVDDALLDGTQTVEIVAGHAAYVSGRESVSVTDAESLSLSVDVARFREDAGAGVATATVTRSNTDTQSALVVALVNRDSSELAIPGSVTIPAGSRSATFAIDAVDDALLDGVQSVVIEAFAEKYGSGSVAVEVTDVETLTVAIGESSIVENEGAGAATGIVARSNTDTALALTVQLTVSDATEAAVSPTVTIPAGAASVSFAIDAVDDRLLDGMQRVTITSAAAGYFSGSDQLDVLDHETLDIAIDRSSIAENAGAGAATATVTRSNTDIDQPLTVGLVSGDTTEATVPVSVTIPAGATAIGFSVDAIDDDLLDGTQVALLTATAAGYVGGNRAIDITDFETITVVIGSDSIREDDGAAAATGFVRRSNSDIATAITVELVSDDTTEAVVAASVTIPAGAPSAEFAINAVDDRLLDGMQQVAIAAVSTGYQSGMDTLEVLDHETLSVSIADATIVESAGASATVGTVTRSNTDTSNPIVVQLGSSDATEAAVPQSVTIPAGAASIDFAIDAVDDRLLDGTQGVTISASAASYFTGSESVDVADYETITVVIAVDSMAENAGVGAATATVTRSNTDVGQSLVVELVSDDASEATVPQTVTIPAGEPSATFAIDAIDDDLLDGTQVATITASSAGYVAGRDSVDVTDYETLRIDVVPAAFSEGAGSGAAVATVTRSNTNIQSELIVSVSGSDPTEISVPSRVTIPAGVSSVEFGVDAVDDLLLDGTQTVAITVSAGGYQEAEAAVEVADDETLTVVIDRDSIVENAGIAAATGTVVRSNSDTSQPLQVTLTSSDASEATVPVTVTIPAGEASVTFAIDSVDDLLLDGTQSVTITGTAAGYFSGSDVVEVSDYETISVVIDRSSVREDAGASAATGTVTRSNEDTSLALVVQLVSSDVSELAVPTTVTIPAGAASADFAIDAIDDLLLDGTQAVAISAGAVGYFGGDAELGVGDFETLSIAIGEGSISEAAGVAAATATVTRSNIDNQAALTINLVSSDTTEAVVPPAIVIPAGEMSTTFALDAIDDLLLDGTQNVVITGASAGYESGSDSVDVVDYETLSLSISLASIAENAGPGAGTARVVRSNTDNGEDLVVRLMSSDTSEIVVTGEVTIPAGAAEVEFALDAIDDDLLDGLQTVVISADAGGYVAGADEIDVVDHETISLELSTESVVESDGSAAAMLTVRRSNVDIDAEVVVALESGDTTEAMVPLTVTIPAGSTSAVVNVDAVDDALLDGTQTVTMTGAASGYESGAALLNVEDHEWLTLAFDRESVAENAGEAAAMVTIVRSNVDFAGSLTVAIALDDSSELAVPISVTIPAGSDRVTVAVDALDDTLLDGTQTVVLTASAIGYQSGGDSIDVTDFETLSVVVAASEIAENSGPASTTVRIVRSNTDTGEPLLVSLSSSDVSEATVPSTATIASGAAFVDVPVDAIDDLLFDGTQQVVFAARSDGYESGSDVLDVTDFEELSIRLDRDEFSERDGAGAAVLRVTRGNSDVDAAVVVDLSSSDTTEARLPDQVTIPAGASFVDVPVDAIDDSLLDGANIVEIGASSIGYADVAPVTLRVLDYETLTVSVSPAVIDEDSEGVGRTEVTIVRGNSDLDQPITVDLAGDDTEIDLPAAMTIPAGSASVSFSADVVRDYVIDGDQVVTIRVSNPDYETGETNITVLDDPFPWYNDRDPYDVNDDGFVTPIDAFLVIEFLTGEGAGGRPPEGAPPPFYDVNNSGIISPLDALLVINRLQELAAGGEGEASALRFSSLPDQGTFEPASAAASESTAARNSYEVGDVCLLPLPVGTASNRTLSAADAFALEDLLDDVAEDVARNWEAGDEARDAS